MVNGFGIYSTGSAWKRPYNVSKVLLREPEKCPVCEKTFLSLYPLMGCVDHDGLDEI